MPDATVMRGTCLPLPRPARGRLPGGGNRLGVGVLLCGLVAAQALLSSRLPRDWAEQTSPGAAPSAAQVALASLGETRAAAYAMTLFVQSFDAQGGSSLRLRVLDAGAIGSWLDTALDLHPDSGYPLLLAARVYAEAMQPADARGMLERMHRRYLEAPATRWAWEAHAVYVARHVLKELSLAQRYARALREQAPGAAVPAWARQAEIFLLEDLDEPHAARMLLGGLIDSGQVSDPAELAFLVGRLGALDGRPGMDRRPEGAGEGGR